MRSAFLLWRLIINYGVPYKGSKSRVAGKIIEFLPAADVFVDLFAGGCAMTHRAMLSGKYKRFIINDIDPMPTQLFIDAVNGKYHDEKRWISREDFFGLKDEDPYVRYCWSFGNNGRDYIYSKETEPFKKLLHEMLTADSVRDRRLLWGKLWREIRSWAFDKKHDYEFRSLEGLERLQSLGYLGRLENLERLQGLENLERLQGLENLERLQGLENLERHSVDYEAVPIPDNSVICCDIPYKGTSGYTKDSKGNDFDYERFYEWAHRQEHPVFISEYWMPEDRFECVLAINSTQRLAKAKDSHVIEKLFIPVR